MDNESKWDKLVNLAENTELDPAICERAIQLAELPTPKPVRRAFPVKWLSMAACLLVCFIGVAVFLPIYFTKQEPVDVYYGYESLISSSIDIQEFAVSNGLDIKYYSDGDSGGEVISDKVTIVGTNKLAYLHQLLLILFENDFDSVDLKIVVLQNAEFSFNLDYKFLNSELVSSGLKVKYRIFEQDGLYTTRAKFEYNNARYFLEVESTNGSVENLDYYIGLLIN